MIKKMRFITCIMTAVIALFAVTVSINASTYNGKTPIGYLGSTTYTFSVSEFRQAYGMNAKFEMQTEHRVETMKMTNLIYEFKNGVGDTMNDVIKYNTFAAYATSPKSSDSGIKAAMGKFSIISYNFGNITRVCSY